VKSKSLLSCKLVFSGKAISLDLKLVPVVLTVKHLEYSCSVTLNHVSNWIQVNILATNKSFQAIIKYSVVFKIFGSENWNKYFLNGRGFGSGGSRAHDDEYFEFIQSDRPIFELQLEESKTVFHPNDVVKGNVRFLGHYRLKQSWIQGKGNESTKGTFIVGPIYTGYIKEY